MAEERILINPELAQDEFYINSMSLFLQNSYGMIDRCKTDVGYLQNVLNVGSQFINYLDILYYKSSTDNYLTKNEIEPNTTTDFYLDMIAQIVGVSRELVLPNVTYDSGAKIWVITTGCIPVVLTNKALITYIVATIFKNIFDGRNITLRQIYSGNSIFLANKNVEPKYVIPSFLTELNIKYQTVTDIPDPLAPAERVNASGLSAQIYSLRTYTNNDIDKQLAQLFLNGSLTIESLGVYYTRNIIASDTEIGVFDSSTWDHTEPLVVYG